MGRRYGTIPVTEVLTQAGSMNWGGGAKVLSSHRIF